MFALEPRPTGSSSSREPTYGTIEEDTREIQIIPTEEAAQNNPAMADTYFSDGIMIPKSDNVSIHQLQPNSQLFVASISSVGANYGLSPDQDS